MITPARDNLKPCLADILRTCVHPSSLVLRVEHVFGKAHAGSRGNAVAGLQEQEQRLQELSRLGDHQDDKGVSDHEFEALSGKTLYRSQAHKRTLTRPTPVHLALSDGHLQLQTLLDRNLHAHEEFLQLRIGDILKVKKFEVRSAPRLNGRGRVVYLRVQECHLASVEQEVTHVDKVNELGLSEGGFLRDADTDDKMPPKNQSREEQQALTAEYRSWSRKRDRKPSQQGSHQSTSTQKKPWNVQDTDSDDDGFDTLAVAQSQVERRREALRQIQSSLANEKKPKSQLVRLNEHTKIDTQERFVAPLSPLRRPSKADEPDSQGLLQRDAVQPSNDIVACSGLPVSPPTRSPRLQTPSLPLPQVAPHLPPDGSPSVTTLSSLLAVPARKSYPCPPLFVLISWVSPSLIHRPNTPFPPKRHLKIHDPSISNRISGLTVSVFVDAAAFLPEVGTVALFKGLVMNRVRTGEDVILNRYPLKVGSQSVEAGGLEDADKKSMEEDWFISDEKKLIEMGYDVEHMKKWWQERNASRKDGGRR
ncbi:hypothetical protein PV04_06597 [Phialophora macrospora]|uniref:Uncharacterized protein n=1 Tax=Phialophora macrospora TaxID=1851006 RepID=A0A0D2G5Q3_9EURO|nr:hypothetical protein PV04_06597 [Phialophora macrospora]